MTMGLKFYLTCFAFLFITPKITNAQYYGLCFTGHETIQEKRTGLDLTAADPLCFNNTFELSFDFSFMTGHTDYFGYIFRIVDQEKRNIDLIYDKSLEAKNHLKLVIGDKMSNIEFDIKLDKLFKNWYNIKLRFDQENQELVLTADGKVYREKIPLKKNCYRICFGANNYKEHEVKDVPPMKIKEIKITEDDKLTHHWPLNEYTGLSATEKIKGKNAGVINPNWIRKMHIEWELVKSAEVAGSASVAFDADRERVFVVTEKSLQTYDVKTEKTTIADYKSGLQPMLYGNQSIYQNELGLLNFYVDFSLMSGFNFSNNTWDSKYTGENVPTNFWHLNKFYSANDNSLYFIGGYGHYNYKRDVQRYHFKDKKLSSVKTSGDFTPRYLAALGATKNGAYILGGYGSTTGQQILNPKNLYDLSFYDVEHKTFKKLFELNPGKEEFAFANSMVIDEKEQSFYALTFVNHIFNSSLAMIKGSLKNPSYEFVGSRIPYTFHDISSFADLYYCKVSKKFVAVLLYYDQKANSSSVKIYTLHAPPEIQQAVHNTPPRFTINWYMVISGALILCMLYLGYKRIRNQKTLAKPSVKVPVITLKEPELVNIKQENTDMPDDIRNTMFLFGDLQLFDREGKDITKLFTPVIKELFLLILLFTVRWGRGVSSEKLEEILWADKSVGSARNNRSVSIAKLKLLLESMDSCEISKETGYWKMLIDYDKIRIDYKEYLNIVKSKTDINKNKIIDLTKIVSRGGFLSNAEYSWLDPLKYEISNEIIDTYLHMAASMKISDDPEFLISLADCVFNFDPVNEEAMAIKCQALVFLGKHSLAKSIFENFNKEYKAIYAESFNKTFQEILG